MATPRASPTQYMDKSVEVGFSQIFHWSIPVFILMNGEDI